MCIGSSSKGNAYALIADKEILLLECGMPLKEVKKAIDYQFIKIKGCLVTHGHQDHLRHIREYIKAGIQVYSNGETRESADIIMGEKFYGMPEKRFFQVGCFEILPFYVPHNNTPNFAYLIEHPEMGTLLFATDFEYLPWTFKQWQIQHFLIECNYDMQFVDKDAPNYEHKLQGHASLSTCLAVIAQNRTPNLRNVIMCHLSSASGAADFFTAEMQNVVGQGVLVDCAVSSRIWELNKELF